MGWVRHGEVCWNDGDHSDEQVGEAASVRFVNPDLPGRLVTVCAYPHAPEREVSSREGSVETFHGYTSDLDSLGIEVMTEFMICGDVEDPGSTEKWSDQRYESLDTRSFDRDVEAAEAAAYKWVDRFDPNRDIHWDGKRF